MCGSILDADGIQDINENGINGVKVRLYNADTRELVDELVTARNPATPSDDGYFKFCVPPGNYYIEFVRPGHLAASAYKEGPDRTIDSDIGFANGIHTTESTGFLQSGEMNCDLDGGYHVKATMGDLVWEDANFDGIQDISEPAIEGVEVKAYDEDNNVLSLGMTDVNGNFIMDGLGKGEYYLEFKLPSGYSFTVPNMGDEDEDSDVDGTFGFATTARFYVDPGDFEPDVDAGAVLLSVTC